MLVVHHLNNSRSQRILWALEELAVPYEIKRYQRDAQTNLAPPELKQIHPLGKSPVITDGNRTIIESGAIIDYIIRRYGKGKLQPAAETPEYDQYQQWLHYAEGSAMLPLMLNLYVGRLGEAGARLHPRIEGEMANHLSYLDSALGGAAVPRGRCADRRGHPDELRRRSRGRIRQARGLPEPRCMDKAHARTSRIQEGAGKGRGIRIRELRCI